MNAHTYSGHNAKTIAPCPLASGAKKLQTTNFPKQALVFTCPQYKSFENTVGKG